MPAGGTGFFNRIWLRCPLLLPPPQQAAGVDPTPAGMNSEQNLAVHRVLAARDYTLVLGMPGAGKTSTIGGFDCAGPLSFEPCGQRASMQARL